MCEVDIEEKDRLAHRLSVRDEILQLQLQYFYKATDLGFQNVEDLAWTIGRDRHII